jgi:hypothetical protein
MLLTGPPVGYVFLIDGKQVACGSSIPEHRLKGLHIQAELYSTEQLKIRLAASGFRTSEAGI